MVVISPFTMPKLSLSTFTTGAKQLVVQEALEIMQSEGFRVLSFTPQTMVASISPLAGAESKTFRAPAWICFSHSARLRKTPVDSKTSSVPKSFQGS